MTLDYMRVVDQRDFDEERDDRRFGSESVLDIDGNVELEDEDDN